jgi:hypothetical protein
MIDIFQENKKQAADFLEMLFYPLDDDEQIEVRYKLVSGNGHMQREFAYSVRHALRIIESLPLPRCDIYFGVAPRMENTGTKEGINRIQCLWADLDAKGGHTRQSRREQISGLSLQPSILVWSGGGFQTYWIFEESESGPHALVQAEQTMARIAKALDGDAVHDYSRILRVAGTYNCKEQNNPRPVEMVPSRRANQYSLQELSEWSVELCGGWETDTPTAPITRSVQKDVLAYPVRDGSRNASLTSVAGSLRSRGLDENSILITLLQVNELSCSPPLPEDEVCRIALSISKYDAGTPRYMNSSATRVFDKGGS